MYFRLGGQLVGVPNVASRSPPASRSAMQRIGVTPMPPAIRMLCVAPRASGSNAAGMHVSLVRQVHQVVDRQAVVAVDVVRVIAIGPLGAHCLFEGR